MTPNRVIIIGAGMAGAVAALKARQEGAEVILVDRGPIGTGTNSCLSNAYFAEPSARYPAASYARDTLDSGRSINDYGAVKRMSQEAPAAFQFLRSLGLPITDGPSGLNIDSPQTGVIPGVVLMRRLAEDLHKTGGIEVQKKFYVTEIAVAEGRVCGVRGIGKTGEETFMASPAVILATGGAGAIYRRNDNQRKILGQGYYLAAKTGLPLWDMEFVQFYPLVIAEPGLPSLILFPPYPREVKLINDTGEDILAKSGLGDINSAIMKRRDEFSAYLYQEDLTSRVYVDFRGLPQRLWDVHPFTILKKLKFDFGRRPVAVSPAAHFFMGGIRTDDGGQTAIEGLFACGEILWGLHGANRMGGNALAECLVTGTVVGRQAARHCQASSPCAAPAEIRPIASSASTPAAQKDDLKALFGRMREISSRNAGVVRSGAGIQEGLCLVAEIKARLGRPEQRDPGERILFEDFRSALFSLEAVLTASLGRQESRGSFIRADFPRENNRRWRKNSCLTYDGERDRFSVQYLPSSAFDR